MFSHIKDNVEAAVIVVAGLIGIGEARYQISRNAKDIEELKDSDFMTHGDCDTAQTACKALQCLKHTQYKDDTEKLTRLIEHVSKQSDEHYEKMIDRLDDNMSKIITLVGNNK